MGCRQHGKSPSFLHITVLAPQGCPVCLGIEVGLGFSGTQARVACVLPELR